MEKIKISNNYYVEIVNNSTNTLADYRLYDVNDNLIASSFNVNAFIEKASQKCRITKAVKNKILERRF